MDAFEWQRGQPAIKTSALVGSLLIFSGCESDGPTDPVEESGTIQVTTTTTGDDIDAGYDVQVAGTTVAISSNGMVSIADLAPGAQTVTLSDVAANCTVAGDNPKSATVVIGQTTAVAFAVACVAPPPEFTLLAADRNGDIYTIDEDTGAETLLWGSAITDGAGGTTDVGVVSSMHWIPSTEQWWLGSGGRATCGGCIMIVPLPLSETPVVELAQTSRGVSGLAVHPTTEKIYTFESDGTDSVYEIDANTGAYTELFSGLGMKNGGTGTTFSLDEVLFVAVYDELWTVDLVTGAPTLVGAMTYTGFPAFTEVSQTIGSMTTRQSDGVVFGILKDGGNSGTLRPTFLVRINLDTAEITNVGVQTHLMDGLTFIMTSLITG